MRVVVTPYRKSSSAAESRLSTEFQAVASSTARRFDTFNSVAVFVIRSVSERILTAIKDVRPGATSISESCCQIRHLESRNVQSRAMRELFDRNFDVLVIGGGITGCGVARDAAMRGLSVALVERDDFASGTSGRSSRLIH